MLSERARAQNRQPAVGEHRRSASRLEALTLPVQSAIASRERGQVPTDVDCDGRYRRSDADARVEQHAGDNER